MGTEKCYDHDRSHIQAFLKYMWLLMRTLARLPPYAGTVVNRGVKKNLLSEYPKGKEFLWHGFTSTTKSIDVLQTEDFLGVTGPRTVFQIQLTQNQARDISDYSPLPEGEVLLPPGSRFRVEAVLVQGGDFTIIQLLELRSPALILDLCEEWGRQNGTTPALPHGGAEPSPASASCSQVNHAGWVRKQSKHLKRWRRRWMVLGRTTLQSFKTETLTGRPTESFELHQVLGAQVDQSLAGEHVQVSIQLSGRNVLFEADSAGDAVVWKDRIDTAASEARRLRTVGTD